VNNDEIIDFFFLKKIYRIFKIVNLLIIIAFLDHNDRYATAVTTPEADKSLLSLSLNILHDLPNDISYSIIKNVNLIEKKLKKKLNNLKKKNLKTKKKKKKKKKKKNILLTS
jgi:N12 class adenine-specific DNA methylase